MRAGVLGHGGLRRLWLGDLVSMLGDWLTYVAVGVLAVDGGGPLAVLGVLLAHTLPRALLAPWAGRIADRYDRRAVLSLGSAARGVAVLGMAIAAACGASGAVAGLFVLRMAMGGVVDAAAGAAVPRLVPAAELPRAHALLGATWSVVFAAGVAAGGLLTAGVGPVVALGLDALTFFVAAAIFAGLPSLRPRREEGEPAIDAAADAGWGPALAFLRRRPAARRAALAKLPVMIANGGAFVLVHALAGQGAAMGTALALGTLHLARALGTGLGAVLWARSSVLRGTETGLRVATAVVLLGASGLVLADGPLGWLLAALVWGVGVGSHWATAATLLQRLTPDSLRGRMTAVDLVSHTTGQCLGGVLGCAGLMVVGCRAPTPPPTTPSPARLELATPAAAPASAPALRSDSSPSLEELLERHAVVADDFVRLELYTWTTPAQIDALRAGGPLLVADASTGGRASPYHRLLAAMDEERRPGHALASILRRTPALSRCRYAWPSPLATVLGLGPQRYGEALVRVRLRSDAVIARLDPTADPPWTLRDGEGRSVEIDELLADPLRLGAVYHLRVDDETSLRFREYVLCNAALVEAWEVGTPAIRERVAAERRLVLDLSHGPFAALPAAQTRWRAWPQWLDAGAPAAWPSRWHRALAFDNDRYRPTPSNLEALAEALADYDPTPPAFEWPPPPSGARPGAGESKASHTSR